MAKLSIGQYHTCDGPPEPFHCGRWRLFSSKMRSYCEFKFETPDLKCTRSTKLTTIDQLAVLDRFKATAKI